MHIPCPCIPWVGLGEGGSGVSFNPAGDSCIAWQFDMPLFIFLYVFLGSRLPLTNTF